MKNNTWDAKNLKKKGYTTNLNWLAGFLPSTVGTVIISAIFWFSPRPYAHNGQTSPFLGVESPIKTKKSKQNPYIQNPQQLYSNLQFFKRQLPLNKKSRNFPSSLPHIPRDSPGLFIKFPIFQTKDTRIPMCPRPRPSKLKGSCVQLVEGFTNTNVLSPALKKLGHSVSI